MWPRTQPLEATADRRRMTERIVDLVLLAEGRHMLAMLRERGMGGIEAIGAAARIASTNVLLLLGSDYGDNTTRDRMVHRLTRWLRSDDIIDDI